MEDESCICELQRAEAAQKGAEDASKAGMVGLR